MRGLWRCVLVVLSCAFFLSGWGAASEIPLWLGGWAAPVPLDWPAGSCAAPADALELALWQVVTEHGLRPDLTCGNAFVEYLRTPRDLSTPTDAFGVIGEQVRSARREVLLTSMEWHAGPGKPGGLFAHALGDLYRQVKATPGAYPDGMTVRVLLGGFPDVQRPDGASQPLALLRDLLALGVPLTDTGVGWQVSILNYRYFPHSHVKMHIIDGQDVTVAGFNFSDWHLSAQDGGRNLHDLGLRMRGPVALDAVAAFDDLWRHSQQLRCPPEVTAVTSALECRMGDPDPVTHPRTAQVAVRQAEARAYLLYRRTAGVDQADRAHLALMGAARQSMDLMQADFSPGLNCWFAYLTPDECPVSAWPTYLRAVLDAVTRGVRVRVLLVDYEISSIPNRSGLALLRAELIRRGLQDRFEARYTDFAMHTKALSVDDRVVVVGSMNFHFSAWGNLGLAEAALATSDPQAVQQHDALFNELWRTSSRPTPPEWWFRNLEGPAQDPGAP